MPDEPPIPEGHMRCEFCWETFANPVELLLHEAVHDDQMYFIDGCTDA